ncbi:hypothetical protein IMK15_00100 [Sneathia sp. DSM 16631]|uniref:TonB-dependent receptor n=1 Tax=Sneathia sp. DSM 16631 TaxID=2777994 RepID=UPI00186669FB|nr:TonB-dependent receptor [Sneathia sp. DSM 16631]MBE3030384.1 hypothetical protein [Sneathia sp. DSM 16631]
MKKTLILLTMISSVATFSKTNGFVEAYNENEANFKKNTDATFTAKELGIKTQVNVARTNLSFGGDFKFKDLQLNNTTPKNFLNHSSVWIKYDLSKKETGINSYVKATIKPKFHAEESGKEMEQVSKLKEEIQQLKKEKEKLIQDQKNAENDDIKDKEKVKELTKKDTELQEKIKQNTAEKTKIEKNKKENDEKLEKERAAKDKIEEQANQALENAKKQKLPEKLPESEIKKREENKKKALEPLEKNIENFETEKAKFEREIEKIDETLKSINKQIEQNKEEIEKRNKNINEANKAITKAKAALEANNLKITEKNAIKNQIEVYQDNGGIDLEGDLSYKTEGAVFGVNSVLNVPFSNTYIKGNVEFTKDFATLIKSTHTAYFGVSDVLSGGLSVQHSYKGEDAMKYVSAKLDGKYAVSNDLDLIGKFRFKYQFNGEIDFKNEYLGNKDLLSFVNPKWNVSPLTYIHMYSLGLNYRKTLNITGFVGHGYEKTKDVNYLNYGVMADVKYTGIDKLTLKANATLSGLKVGNNNIGLFEFGANAKYDFNATDKFTVSPELDANVKFKTKEKVEDVKFVLTPKVSVKYVPVNGLTLSGSVGVPVTVKNSAYESTSIKTNLNIRYEW